MSRIYFQIQGGLNMAPDKIYVEIRDLGTGYMTDVSLSPGNGYPEYIRKDALLEWLEGMMAIEWATEDFADGYDSALKDVIEHINKM